MTDGADGQFQTAQIAVCGDTNLVEGGSMALCPAVLLGFKEDRSGQCGGDSLVEKRTMQVILPGDEAG